MRTLKFIVLAATGVATGKKLNTKIIVPKTMAKTLTNTPKIPGRWNGPHISWLTSPVCLAMSFGDTIAPVRRRQSRKTSTMMYEAYKQLTLRDTTSLKAVEEPMLISPIRQAMIDVTIIAGRGIALLGWTCKASIESSSTDRARMTNLAHETPTWKATITGKSPDHSRLCSQDCNGAGRIHDNDDCYH